jgi:hypothetical protein
MLEISEPAQEASVFKKNSAPPNCFVIDVVVVVVFIPPKYYMVLCPRARLKLSVPNVT